MKLHNEEKRVREINFAAGAKIIGGCCGTTPRHFREMRNTKKTPVSIRYSAYEHFSKLGRSWQETDKSKKRIKKGLV